MVYKIFSKFLRVLVDIKAELDKYSKPKIFWAEYEMVVLEVGIQDCTNEAIARRLGKGLISK